MCIIEHKALIFLHLLNFFFLLHHVALPCFPCSSDILDYIYICICISSPLYCIGSWHCEVYDFINILPLPYPHFSIWLHSIHSPRLILTITHFGNPSMTSPFWFTKYFELCSIVGAGDSAENKTGLLPS